MRRLNKLQITQLVVFILYWFVCFVIIWFFMQPSFITNNILNALLFAIVLLLVYVCLYLTIERCCCYTSYSYDASMAATETKDLNSSYKQKVAQKRTNAEDVAALQDRVYAATTVLNSPDAVHFQNSSPESALVKEAEPFTISNESLAESEEPKQIRFVTTCSLYYDGKSYHDFKWFMVGKGANF